MIQDVSATGMMSHKNAATGVDEVWDYIIRKVRRWKTFEKQNK